MKNKALLTILLASSACAAFASYAATQTSSKQLGEAINQLPQNIQLDTSQSQLEMQAKGKIKQFSTELKTALVTAIKKDGLASAVAVCQEQAPQIAASLSNDGWTVARTSLKTRNASNQPDNWETKVLNNFVKQASEGQEPASLSASLVNDNDFRYMKAIPTGQVCLACHGSNVDPELQQTINARYPHDTATGFALNDIRGAFTITKDISHE